MTDRLRKSRTKTRHVTLACGASVVVGVAWAFLPPNRVKIGAPSLASAIQQPEDMKLPPLDIKAFDTPVWTIAAAPQPPAPPPPPPPPPPPLKLQLIGILKEDESYRAVLYDPDSNKLFVVATGQDVLGHKIDQVAADAVTLRDGTLVRALALKAGAGVGGGP